jgi:hypothetical protein
MARNNGSTSSNSSRRSKSNGARRRSRPKSKAGRSSHNPAKSNPDASPLTRGYNVGRRTGVAAVDTLKSAGSRTVETIGEHPIPLALIGAGLAWLLLEGRGIRPANARILERGRDAMGELGSSIADAAGTAGSAIADAAETIAEGASYVGEYASSAASAVSETTTQGYQYTRQTLADLWERHPLAVSAAILTTGIAAGMLLPATPRERELLGTTASDAVRKVRRKGSELLAEGRRMAATTAKAVAREGRRQGLTPGEIGTKVKRLARSGRKALTE